MSSTGSDDASRKRIPIGTQRAGVKPPSMPARHEYVGGQELAEAALSPAPVNPVPVNPAQVNPAPSQRNATPSSDRPREQNREKRSRGGSQSSFTDVLPQQKRVAVPSLRQALEEDLESDFQAALEGLSIDELLQGSESLQPEHSIEPGGQIAGTVISVGADTAFVDLGGRQQGALKLAGLETVPAVGDRLELSVGSRNEDDSLYELSLANRAVSVENWTQLAAGMIVEARVTGANKGGLECEVAGLSGFMPASLVSPYRIENLAELVGQTLESLVTEIVPEARRLVLSRRAVVERQASDARTKLLETLEVGATLEGVVRSVRDFGAFVDIGEGVDGLIHVSQLSWERVENPADVVAIGQRMRVVVKKVDRQTGKIALSARDLIESPWKQVAYKYHIGATVRGTVTRIAQFGAFVRLEPGVEGLVHVSEIASRHVRSVGDAVKEGEEVECRVLSVDPDEQRMSLSIKALAARPGELSAPLGGPDNRPEQEAEPPAALVKPSSRILKGGLGGGSNNSTGLRFGN